MELNPDTCEHNSTIRIDDELRCLDCADILAVRVSPKVKMTLWQVQATRGTSEQVPTFYLDAQVQGILDEDAAIKVAADILGFDALNTHRISVMRINYNVTPGGN